MRAKTGGEASGGMLFVGVLIVAMVSALLTLGVVRLAAPAQAQGVVRSEILSDDFEEIRPRPAGPWYVINLGSEDGQPQRWEGQECGSDSCVRARMAGRVSYAELSVAPSVTPGFYVNAELAEQRTGYAAGQPGRWEPAPGHPVELNARVRWSANHGADGGGGAQGSSGIWLWNSPVDVNATEYADFQAFGISWTTGDSAVLRGINASVVRTTQFGPYPVWSATPARPPNLREWNDVTMLWSENAQGAQSVRFWLNRRPLGTARLDEPFGPLSVEIWSDNQVPTQTGIEFRNPSAPQSFEVDRIEVGWR